MKKKYQKKYGHERRYAHFFIKKKVENQESTIDSNIEIAVAKKRKS